MAVVGWDVIRLLRGMPVRLGHQACDVPRPKSKKAGSDPAFFA